MIDAANEQDLDDLAVAVVGMAGRFPGARDVQEYWSNLRAGACSVTWLDREVLRAQGAPSDLIDHDRYVPAAYLLEGSDRFDAEFFGYSPREAELLDPQHRLFLECAWSGFEDAGLDPSVWPGVVGVWAGSGYNTYLINHVLSRPDSVAAVGHKQVLVGNRADYLTSRVAYKMGLTGPAVTVQTACSTSLVAIAQACQSLLSYECDAALAGGVAVGPDRHQGYVFEQDGILSPDGLTRTLDRRAGGTVGGDGVGVVVLKRLEDARSDGDHVRAVIRGFAVNNDGANRVGFSAPSAASQAVVIKRAMEAAGVGPSDLQYVELHGTATSLGDPIEMAALSAAFEGADVNSTYIGAAKANVGHLDAAAGVAGLIKTVLALQHREIPPLPNFEVPNPRLTLTDGPFRVSTSVVPWPSVQGPRRAGVSSFGLGGTNAHVVVEEAPVRERRRVEPNREELLVWSARTPEDAAQISRRLTTALRRDTGIELRDIARTLQRGRRHLACRRALVAADTAEVVDALESMDGQILESEWRPGRTRAVAFLVGGFGAERPGMGAELYASEPVFRQVIDDCAQIVDGLGIDLRPVLLNDGPDTPEHPIHQPSTGYPAVFAFELALIRLWESWGVVPSALAGHSLGEYVVSHLAGVFGLGDALLLVVRRAQLLEQHAAGAMLAVTLTEADVQDFLGEDLSVAAVNDSFSCVLAGSAAAVDRVIPELDRVGVVTQRLASPYAFHSPLVDAAAEEYEDVLAAVTMSAPTIPFVSNLTGTWITDEEATDPRYWVRHMREPVRFADSVGALWSVPEVVMLEIGLGQTLTAGAMQHRARRDLGTGAVVLASLPGTTPGSSTARGSLLRAAGRLWLAGVDTPFPVDPDARRVPLPTYPFRGPRYWVDAVEASRASDQGARHRVDQNAWYYVPTWWHEPSTPVEARTDQSWLVFVGRQPWCEELVQRLRSRGESVTVVRGAPATTEEGDDFALDHGDAAQLARLVTVLGTRGRIPDRTVFAWPDEADAFSAIVAWSRACRTWMESQPQRWDLITTRTLPLVDLSSLVPERAAVGGLLQVVGQEFPHLTVVHIDLAIGEDGREDVAVRIVSELDASPDQSEVALSSGRRWVRGYRPASRPPAPSRVRPGGRYVITGGLGRIGRVAARVLAEASPVHLLVLARSGVDLLPADLASLLTDGTTIDVRVADVADSTQVREAIAGFGRVDGVIHCAGITGAAAHAPVVDIAPGDLAEQLGPKLQGADNLRLALEGQPLDFALLCSSVSSILGGLEFGTYAAANVALDVFAARWWSSQQPWCSVSWEAWAFPGRDGSAEGLGAAVKDLALDPEEGAEVLRRLLQGEHSERVVVSTGNLDDRISAWRRPAIAETPTVVHERPHLHTPYVAPASSTETAVGRAWSEVLGLERVGANDSFFELGGSSLLGLQVVHRLRSTFALSLPLNSIYEAPTVRRLAGLVEDLTKRPQEGSRS